MKSLKLLLLVFLSNFLIAQTNLNNPQQIGQTTRNQNVGNGFQVEDTLLVKGKVFFKNLSISTDTFINVSDINGKIGKIGKTSLLNSSSQTLSISNDTLTISNGNSVILPIYFQSDSATITSYDVLNSQNAPPISPNTGDTYLVGTSPSGAWVGHAKDIAEWNGSSWDFTDGVQGDFLYNATTALTYIFRSGNWVQTTGIPALNNGNTISSGLKIGTNNLKSLTFETNNKSVSRFDSIGRFYVYDTALRNSNKFLQIDSATGRLIASAISGTSGGGSGDNIYTVDGTILDDRTVDMDDKSLIFQSASNYLAFNQDPFEEGNQVAYLKYGDSVDLNDQQQSYLVLGDNGATNPNVRIGVGGVDGDSITAMIDISKNVGAGTTSLNIEAGDIRIRPSVNLVISNRPLDNDATILYAKNASGNTVELEKSSISGYRGTATLSSGTVTVSTASIHTGYKIYVSVDTPSGTLGFLSAPTGSIVDGTEFVINSSSVLDNSTVNWWIAP